MANENDVISRQLDRIAGTRAETNRSVWTVFSVFMAANAVIVSAVANDHPASVRALLSAIGAFTGLIWFAFLARAIGHLDFNEHVMELLEKEVGIAPQFSVLYQRNEQAHRQYAAAHFQWPIRPMMKSVTATVFVSWLIAFIWFCLAIQF